ncbi:MepB family protein [Timonella sp. A28]|uniref:MepB family protein n=1 Tax=Timonella sp. A28 TaxID=3442640 RepID=UPI003EB78B69
MSHHPFHTYAQHVFVDTDLTYRLTPEPENAEYQACTVTIADTLWRVRTAKITPTKPGAFVACWQRAADGTTEPFPADDRVHGLLVFVNENQRSGVFQFTQSHLEQLGVLSTPKQAGKRGFRLYPAWCTNLNPQATKTQAAQAPAFIDLTPPLTTTAQEQALQTLLHNSHM